MASDSGIVTGTLRQRRSLGTEVERVAQSATLATRVGRPRSGAQVLVHSTKTNLVGKADLSCHIMGVRGNNKHEL
jgi:hypothetical protein